MALDMSTFENATLKKDNQIAIVGFVMGLVSFVCCGGVGTAIIGLICSIMGLKNAKASTDNKNGTLAIAGIIVSALGIVSSAVILIQIIPGLVVAITSWCAAHC